MKKITFLLILVSLSLSMASISYAQNNTDFSAGSDIIFKTDPSKKPEKKTSNHRNKLIPQEAEVTVTEDKHAGKYILPTVQNISKLYWKKNALVESNNTAIDNFLLINECEIYEKFYNDDFEWQRIRKAAREMIKENKDSFSYKFKIVIPIDLGRYDLERQGFPLINKTAFKDLRRVEIGGNQNNVKICGKQNAIDLYPRNIILILNKPFNYEFVELDEHVAQAYIIRQKYERENRPKELKNKSFDRLAFARIRITFSEYQGVTKGRDNFPLSIMFGKLDGIDIFEDASEKRLLTTTDLN